MADYFSNLPTELLFLVCEYAKVADIARLIRTSRSFTRLQQFLYRRAASWNADRYDSADYIFLLRCVDYSNLNALTHLLATGARPNIYKDIGRPCDLLDSLLHQAVETDDAAFVEVILSHYPDADTLDANEQTPLALAALNGNAAMVSLLLPVTTDQYIPNAIKSAVDGGDLVCVNLLIAAAPDTIAISEALGFPIQPDILRALLEAGAVMEDSPGFYHPLLQAAKENDSESVRILLEYGAEVDTLHQFGNRPLETPLLCAARQAVGLDNTDAVRYMIEAGAEVDWSLFLLQRWGVTPAVREQMKECLERVRLEVEHEREAQGDILVGD